MEAEGCCPCSGVSTIADDWEEKGVLGCERESVPFLILRISFAT